MNQISSTRQLHYDLLRIFASFMVVMLPRQRILLG